MLFSAVGTPATLTGSLDDIAFRFGMKFSGSGGVAPIPSIKILELLECV